MNFYPIYSMTPRLSFFNWIISTESNPNNVHLFRFPISFWPWLKLSFYKECITWKLCYLLPTSYSKNMMEPLANNSHVRSLFELLSVQWILNVCMFKWNGLAAIIYLSSFIIVRDDDKTMKNYAIHSGPGLKINKNYNR